MSDSVQKRSLARVRFAPSPTGYLHVGGARTALFNWLFARRQGGTMILRVEDTDAERNKPELVQGILDGLRWLGVNWDEGPFYQSQRTELYRAAAKKCLANGAAFLCYCPAEKYAGGDHTEPAQDEEPKAGGPRRVTRCSCRDGKPSTPGVKPAVRFKVPLGGTTKFLDAVVGGREFSNEEIEDFVLLRSGKGEEEFGQSMRSEEHTSELQSQSNLVCRLLLEKNKHLVGRASRPRAGLMTQGIADSVPVDPLGGFLLLLPTRSALRFADPASLGRSRRHVCGAP